MNLIFDLQRFDAEISDGKVTIPAGESFTLDDVIYTAGSSGAVLIANTSVSNNVYSAKKNHGH